MKKALIFWGGWDGHEPRQCAELFAEALWPRGVKAELVNSLTVLDDKAWLASCDLIIPMWTMFTGELLTLQQEDNLVGAVQGGIGLAGFHGGMGDSFRGSVGYQWMVGGQFVGHPENFKDYTVNLLNTPNPITAGFADFRVHTEQYYMLVDPRNEVLATTTFHPPSAPWIEGVVMPCIWRKMHGKGRVFYSSLGHHCSEFHSVPEQMEITLRGMLWAARVS